MAPLTAERDGRVLVVKLDNAPSHLIDRGVIAALTELVRSIERDRTLGAVVLTGAAPGRFLIHYDIGEMLDGAQGVTVPLPPSAAGAAGRAVAAAARVPGGRRALRRTPLRGVLDLEATTGLFRRLGRLDKVVLAAIGGPAVGAACELALACDLRYVADDVEAIGSLEIAQGFAPGAGGTQRQTRALGPARALEAILEARLLSAADALAAGFAHRVVPAERLLEEAVATGHRLARRAPVAVAAVKRALYDGASRPLDEGLALERSWFMAALSRPAARRALKRYVDELAETGRGAWEDRATFERWREGTAVDLVGGPETAGRG
jgi:enoyl-CoA hydratase/carnithine racemase